MALQPASLVFRRMTADPFELAIRFYDDYFDPTVVGHIGQEEENMRQYGEVGKGLL